ncbi:MAG: hypothetical protein QMC93_01190 [Patescibacteria group bacterium]|nr:hypothetical protein [Patescibacteria group bacterium]
MAKLQPDLVNKEFQYKDITLLPNRLPHFERDEVDLKSRLFETALSGNRF